MTKRCRIAVIGAGLAGVQIAKRFSGKADVQVFEKSRGFGGRMSTRRAGAFQFDHGAQYFTAHSAGFQSLLKPYIETGIVAQWTPRLATLGRAHAAAPVWTAPRYVAVPGMNALVKAMAVGVQVHRAIRIAEIRKHARGWRLTSETEEDCGTFDWVICTAPAEQTQKLMPEVFAARSALAEARTQGCYALMVGLEAPLKLAWDAAVVHEGPLAWIAANQTKPGRSGAISLLCQSDNAWAEAHLEDDQEAVEAQLLAELTRLTGVDVSGAAYRSLHRWRFAKVVTPAAQPFLLDPENRLAAAGDWCGAGRVEAAFESAVALSDGLDALL